MAFAPTKPWKLPFITTWGGSPNRNLPTNSAEEAQRDRKRSIVALTVGFIIQALQILLGSAGRSVFSLDKYLSWMSQGLPKGYASGESCLQNGTYPVAPECPAAGSYIIGESSTCASRVLNTVWGGAS